MMNIRKFQQSLKCYKFIKFCEFAHCGDADFPFYHSDAFTYDYHTYGMRLMFVTHTPASN